MRLPLRSIFEKAGIGQVPEAAPEGGFPFATDPRPGRYQAILIITVLVSV